MQKRRAHNVDSGLPLTEADLQPKAGKPKYTSRHKARHGQQSSRYMGCILMVGMVIGAFYLGTRLHSGFGYAHKVYQKSRGEHERKADQIANGMKSDLTQFPSLEYPLQHSELVGLYFGASWCPICARFAPKLNAHFGDVLLPPNSDQSVPPTQRAQLSIVYISSDKTEEAFSKSLGKNWIAVPFESEERTGLKKHFSVCSRPEVELLGIDRKHESPTLILLDSETQGVISSHGVEDVDECGLNALDHWMDLSKLARALEEKFDADH